MASYGRMEDSDIIDGLDVWYLKRSGLWNIINHYRETGEKSRVFKAWMIGTVLGFGPLFLTSAIAPFYIEKDLEGLTLILLNPVSATQMAIKFYILWFSMEKQAQLLDLMNRRFLTYVPPEKQLHVAEIMLQAAKRSTFLANLGITINCITVSVWNILPILRSEYFREGLGITIFGTPKAKDHNKILGFWYPFEIDDAPMVHVIYVYEFFICFWAGFIITMMEALVVQLICLLTAYLRVISYLMMELKKSPHDMNSTNAKFNDESWRLLQYVKEHQKMMTQVEFFITNIIFRSCTILLNYYRVGDDMRKLYNFLVSGQLSTGLIILIIGIFNFFLVSDDGDVVTMFKFVIFTMYTLVEVILYCYCGSDLQVVSEDVCFAAYSSDWYTLGVEFRNRLQMVMVRSKNAVHLKAGRLYPVNLVALNNILQMAYSTSMLLYRITSKNR